MFGYESATVCLQLLAKKLAITKVYKYNISLLCSQLGALFPNGEEFCNIMYNIALWTKVSEKKQQTKIKRVKGYIFK